MVDIKLQIPDSFYQEEVRCGYTVSHEMKQIWAVELDLLNEFMRVCQKHNLTFYADAGTMLGAARHGGMIPWDDDIDVIMLRDQYDQLCKIAPDEFQHPYFFQTEETDPGSLRGHAQLRNSMTTGILTTEKNYRFKFNQGIFLDIFPIETVPEAPALRKEQCEQLLALHSQYLKYAYWTKNRYVRPQGKQKAFIKRCNYWLNAIPERIWHRHQRYYQQFLKELVRYQGTESPYVAKLVLLPFKERRLWEKKDFEGVEYLPFEMLTIPVPSGYVNILDKFYGNWHEFVVGTATHGGTFFDVDKPYTEYIK